MSEDLYEIENENLRSEISTLSKGRLSDYYREFILNHENVIKNFKIEKYREMDMRKAVGALCKLLFHEILKDEADNFYNEGGPDGNRFSLSQTDNPDGIVFFFKGKDTGRKKRSEIEKEKGERVPGGEILQIGAALAATLNYSQYDPKYNVFKRIHETVYSYESNDKEHICADVDKSKYSLTGRINDYESFVHNVLTVFDQYLQIKLIGRISSATTSDFNDLLRAKVVEQAITNETVESLVKTIKDCVETYYSETMLLIAPKEVPLDLIRAITHIPWNLIVTFDPNSDHDGHLIDVLRKEWSGIRPFKICNEYDMVGEGIDETNIVYANGDMPVLSVTKVKDWNAKYKNLLKGSISKVRRGSENICAFILTEDSNDKLFNKAWLNTLSDGDKVFTVGNISSEVMEELEEEHYFEHTNFNISSYQATCAFNAIAITANNVKSYNCVGLSAEDIARYAAYGIKIIRPIPLSSEKSLSPISEFYAGGNVNENDLYNNYDVRRRFYDDLKARIEARIESGARFIHYIKQTPSSGATTLAMRLAYDLAELSDRGKLKSPVLPIIISELKVQGINPMVERIKDLAIKISPANHILAIVDKSIQSNDFDRLKEALIEGGALRISFIRISEKETSSKEFTSTITDELSEAEKVDFRNIYRRHAIAMSIDNNVINESLKYVIDFPIALYRDDKTYLNIPEYVNASISPFDGDKMILIRHILSLIGFSSEYVVNTDNYVEGFLFNRIIGKKFSDWYQHNLERKERKAFERIISFEEKEKKRTGRLRTRFSKFNSAVMNLSEKSLADLAREYIHLFFEDQNLAADPKLVNNYIIDLFFKKEGYEEDDRDYYGKSESEKFYKKLSSVFNDIHDSDSISLVFDELEKHIGTHPRYIVSKAQYLYNRAYFMDSEEHNAKVFNDARDLLERILTDGTPDREFESVVYQSLGVLNYRRLGALRKVDVKNKETLELASRYVTEVIRSCEQAFEINPYDTHSLVTKAQALKSFLNMAKNIEDSQTKGYDFCETESYLEWTAQYEETVESLAGFIVNFDDNNLTSSQNELLKISTNLKEFSLKLIGINCNQLYEVYKQKLDSPRTSNELKKLYINRLFNVIVDAPKNQIRSEKIANLSDDMLEYIEGQLSKSLRLGNLSSYEKIFKLHLFNGRKKSKIQKEIEWLKNWLSKDKNPQSQLWGNYYIALLYFSEILNEGQDFNSYYASAKKFRNIARDYAKLLGRNDTKDFYYYRVGQGLQCITETSNNASYMEGKIIEIKSNRQGIVMLDCGIEASFAPKGEFLMEDADKHTRIRAKVGFRFSGLGLYGIERIENDYEDVIDNNSYSLSSSIKCEITIREEENPFGNKYKAAEINNRQEFSIKSDDNHDMPDEVYGLEEGYIYPGVYHEDRFGRCYITGDWKETWIEFLNIEGSIEEGIYDEADVEFSVKIIENPDNGDKKWVAIDVKFPEE